MIRLAQFTAAGLYTGETLTVPLMLTPVALGGVLAGHALSRRLRSEGVSRVVYALLMVLGLVLVVRS